MRRAGIATTFVLSLVALTLMACTSEPPEGSDRVGPLRDAVDLAMEVREGFEEVRNEVVTGRAARRVLGEEPARMQERIEAWWEWLREAQGTATGEIEDLRQLLTR